MSAAAARKSPLQTLLRSPGFGRLCVVIAGLAIWEILARTVTDPNFVSPPSRVVRALATQTLVDPKVLNAIAITFGELLAAFGLALLIGTAAGVVVGAGERIRRGTYRLVLMLYAIPQVTVLPLFVMFFGLGPASKVAFGFTHGVFPIVVNVAAGMGDINPILLRAARSMGASRAQILRHVVFPHLVPSLFAGMRLGMAMALLGVILAELYASIDGVGYFAQLYAESFDSAQLFALIVVLAFMAVVLNELARRAELWTARRWRVMQ
jgi:ABC-type nitrate/sulfonate/bicarbonate transport system permease component